MLINIQNIFKSKSQFINSLEAIETMFVSNIIHLTLICPSGVHLYIGNDVCACANHGVIDNTIIKTYMRIARSFIHPHPQVVTRQQRQKLQTPTFEVIEK